MWFSNYVLPVLIAIAIMLLVLWPTERSGFRLLVRWGVPHPRPDQVAVAVRYLWQRRILYEILFVVVPPLARPLLTNTIDLPGFSIVVPLLVAMLIAELVATLRPTGGVRVASLDPRGWRDLLPRWPVVAMAVLVVLAVAWSVAGLVVQPWANASAAALSAYEANPPDGAEVDFSGGYVADVATPTSWFALGHVVAAVVVTVLLVRFAVRRPSVSDETVDLALRTRSARVAVGICIGWLGAAVAVAVERIQFLHNLSVSGFPATPTPPAWLTSGLDATGSAVGLAAQFGALLCWVLVANPTRRSLAAVRA
jgi:hypothetical protein